MLAIQLSCLSLQANIKKPSIFNKILGLFLQKIFLLKRTEAKPPVIASAAMPERVAHVRVILTKRASGSLSVAIS